jgi:exonuclease SbcC
MRILNIRFQNLNSLAGEWSIDLAHPAFLSDGVFAITGPTGAGKSTILDALCLALYGRTPRLSRIGKAGNEIMSRQTGACFAEVTFETGTGRYRCHWSQRRARKKPDGELQAPRHEIAEADQAGQAGKIIETKIRGVAEQIEAVTGMDYERFTRSMLLAQGGFAAFLEASPDERSPILEQITGTEIYSQLSIRAHERRAEERKKLELLQEKLAGTPLLAPEVAQHYQNELAQKIAQEAKCAVRLQHNHQAIVWREGVARLEAESIALAQEKANLQAQIKAFAPDQARLLAANHALELAADYSLTIETRKAQAADEAALSAARQSRPEHANAARQAELAAQAASQQRAIRKADQQQAQPLLRKARALDTQIATHKTSSAAMVAAIAARKTARAALANRQNAHRQTLSQQQNAWQTLCQQREATQADSALAAAFSGLETRFAALETLRRQMAEKQAAIIEADQAAQAAAQAAATQTAARQKAAQARSALQAALLEAQAAQAKTLENRELADWRKSQADHIARDHALVRAQEGERARRQIQQAQRELATRQTALVAEANALACALADDLERQGARIRERDLLENQLRLLQKIEDLEAARQQLREGEACPLCGALEHPFHRGDTPIPAPNETRQRLDALRRDLTLADKAIAQTRIKQAEVAKEGEQAAIRQKEYALRLDEMDRVLSGLFAGLLSEIGADFSADCDTGCGADFDTNGALDDTALAEKLAARQAENAEQLARVTHVLKAAEDAEKALRAQAALLEHAKATEAQAERDAQIALHQHERIVERQERLRQEFAAQQAGHDQALRETLAAAAPFGVFGAFGAFDAFGAFGAAPASSAATPTSEHLRDILEQLRLRRDQWLARQKESDELAQKIAANTLQAHHLAEQAQQMESELNRLQEQQTDGLAEQARLQAERQQILGEQNPDDEETRLAAALEAAEKTLEAAHQKQAETAQTLLRWNAQIEALEKATETRAARLLELEQILSTRLNALGFMDEAHYQSACLPEQARKTLAEYAQKLAEKNTAIIAQEKEKTTLLATERARQLSEQTLDALKTEREALAGEQKQCQQAIGALQKSLQDDEARKQQCAAQAAAIVQQKTECARWDALHELIGSADGKKYRNFAQGLTLEIMVGHANRQLQKMTDRYLLTLDAKTPLELNVIDNDQAGEIRSTRNLSGGECFIVSLSLALGLSKMASKNVRVDSLFLDEGFGSLDEDALDTALEALASLPQDGKLIGLISHVPAIRERIATQIRVTPQTGGHSRIDGPGCAP